MRRDKISFFKKIGTKIAIVLIASSFGAIILTGFSLIGLSVETLKKNIFQRNLQIARRAIGEISLYLEDSINEPKVVAEFLIQIRNIELFADITLENLSYTNAKYRSIWLVNDHGSILADSVLDDSAKYKIDLNLLQTADRRDHLLSSVFCKTRWQWYSLHDNSRSCRHR